MLTDILMLVGGMVLLLTGGRLLIAGAVSTATRLGVSTLLIGLTLVAWGTSAPELALNLVSAAKGRGDLALGNVVGANICNMGLVLGLCALIRPLLVEERIIRVELVLNAVVLGLLASVGLSLGLPWWTAAALLGLFVVYSVWTIRAAVHQSAATRLERRTEAAAAAAAAQAGGGAGETGGGNGGGNGGVDQPLGWWAIAACFAVGLPLLGYGGSLASDGAVGIAAALGVPSAVIGVTVVSIGTTLPEMITGLMAVRMGQADLAMGNAIGSCLFNVCAIFGLAGLISPPEVGGLSGPFALPMITMVVLALVLIPMSRTTGRTVSRIEGGVLLAIYALFLTASAVLALQRG
jgi:cation:H+ antiporter